MKTLGKYTVLQELGKGGAGVIYRAIDPVLEREVAIKTQIVDVVRDQESVTRFLREARLVASLEHPNIVTVFEMGKDGNRVYIVMELLRGEDLSTRMRSQGHMSLERKLSIVSEVASGLSHAHAKGIVHRDVKPRNVFLTDRGGVKLLDFGLAHIAQSTLTATGQVIGTPHYMSPEQVLGRKSDRRSDIFSLGSLFYELLTGEKPFDASTLTRLFARILEAEPEPVTDLAPGLSGELSRIVSRMMRKSIDERYSTIHELLRDLARFQGELERKKLELRSEVEAKSRKLRTLLGRRPASPSETGAPAPARLLATLGREDLSFMALLGLRDGIDIELRRIDKVAHPPPGGSHPRDDRKADESYQRARSLFAAGDLAGCLLRVGEALRFSPLHTGAGELSEKLRQAIVERAACLEPGAGLDVLVAAYLAFHAGGVGELANPDSPCQEEDAIARLSEMVLAELPKEPDGERLPG